MDVKLHDDIAGFLGNAHLCGKQLDTGVRLRAGQIVRLNGGTYRMRSVQILRVLTKSPRGQITYRFRFCPEMVAVATPV